MFQVQTSGLVMVMRSKLPDPGAPVPLSDIEKVFSAADREVRRYLIAISDTVARVCEINRLKWDDVGFEKGCLILCTRKKGVHLTPRKVPLFTRLAEILKRIFG
jgi:integrase